MPLLLKFKKHLECLPRKFCRSFSSVLKFEDYLTYRREQAQKSLLVQVQNPTICEELKNFMAEKFGELQSIHHYCLTNKSRSANASSPFPSKGKEFHWVLAEFKSSDSYLHAMEFCRCPPGTVPYYSSMMWYENQFIRTKTFKKDVSLSGNIPSEMFPASCNAPLQGSSLDQQLQFLESSLKLSDLGIRLRFLLACQIENSLKALFPAGCVLPFGSTVSGIGRQSGDLDLVLLSDKAEVFTNNYPIASMDSDTRYLMYQSKLSSGSNSSSSRFQVQRIMETIADILQLVVPGCSHVQRILQARVPILRFWSDFMDMQCDLSMTNSSGLHMSELIYIMTKIDNRFSVLLFAIRSWASSRKVTNPVPGRQPTNFMLVLLLIHFLQYKKLLPTLDIIFNNAGRSDLRLTTDGIDCTFLRNIDDILKYFKPVAYTKPVSTLLFEFFEFYSEFDFSTKGVCLISKNPWGKPDSAPMYIQNPLERHLNVSRNVSKEEVQRFKNECCSALWKLETSQSDKPLSLGDLLMPGIEKHSFEHKIKAKELFAD